MDHNKKRDFLLPNLSPHAADGAVNFFGEDFKCWLEPPFLSRSPVSDISNQGLSSTYHLPSNLFEVELSPILPIAASSNYEELRGINSPPRDISSVNDWLDRIRYQSNPSESLEWDNYSPPLVGSHEEILEEQLVNVNLTETNPNFLDITDIGAAFSVTMNNREDKSFAERTITAEDILLNAC